jgi:hypothetical protein
MTGNGKHTTYKHGNLGDGSLLFSNIIPDESRLLVGNVSHIPDTWLIFVENTGKVML